MLEPLASAATARAIPKSASRARPLVSSSSTFSGLTSRCTTPARPAASSAAARSHTIRAASSSGRRTLAEQPLPQALAGHLVHHVVEEAVGAAGRVYGDDVGVPQPGDRPGLCQEPARDRLVRGELGMNHLDGDPAVERGVGGQKHHAHAAASQLPLEPILRPERRLKCGEEVDGRIAHVRDQWG